MLSPIEGVNPAISGAADAQSSIVTASQMPTFAQAASLSTSSASSAVSLTSSSSLTNIQADLGYLVNGSLGSANDDDILRLIVGLLILMLLNGQQEQNPKATEKLLENLGNFFGSTNGQGSGMLSMSISMEHTTSSIIATESYIAVDAAMTGGSSGGGKGFEAIG